MTTRKIMIGDVAVGEDGPLALIAGPCVVEDEETMMVTAAALKDICSRLGMPLVFKSSFDKANRTSIKSDRGPGLAQGLYILSRIKEELGLPVITDVHKEEECGAVAEVADALQIPAFLSRQTDLIIAAAETGRPINVKKGQFLAPWDMRNVIEKIRSTGNLQILLTERGTSFGHGDLVVDFRGLAIMRAYGYPVVFDATHSLQKPGGRGDASGGQREFAEPLLRAAVAVGIDAIFMEVHPDPDRALSDRDTMIRLADVERLLRSALRIHEAVIDEG
jgi:2-dehydro-3-deoxyphosphooctonate aldolase (KDO 8-P synthase)